MMSCWRYIQPLGCRSPGIGGYSSSSDTSVAPSERASSKAEMVVVGEGGNALLSGVCGGVKNWSLMATMLSLNEDPEGDARQGGIRRGNDEDKDVGNGVVTCDGAGRNMSRWIGSSLVITAGGRGPFSQIV